MLVLTRKPGEKIVIGNNVVVQVLQVQGSRIRIGIESPPGIPILRQELLSDSSPAEAVRRPGENPSLEERPFSRRVSEVPQRPLL